MGTVAVESVGASVAALFLEKDRAKQPHLQCRCTAFKIFPLIYSSRRGWLSLRLKDRVVGGREVFNTVWRINCRVYGALWGGTRASLSIGLRCPSEIVAVTVSMLPAVSWHVAFSLSFSPLFHRPATVLQRGIE